MSRLRQTIWLTSALIIGSATSGAYTGDFGTKLGVTVADQKTNAGIVSDVRPGIRMGVFGRWEVVPNLSLTAEVAYTQRGAKNARVVVPDPVSVNPEPWNANHELGYITIPLVADLSFQTERAVVFGGAGPRFDILIVDSFRSQGQSDVLGPYYDDFERVVVGASLVGGVRLNESRVSLELQYNWDLTDSYTVSDTYYFRSRALDVLFGFTF